METYSIHVENIKCCGCANSIKTKVDAIDGVESTEANVDNGTITVSAELTSKESIISTLKSMGYPETGTVQGLENVKAKASSFVSCAIGNMTKKN